MADLNALIAQGAQFAAPPDPFAQYGKMQQLRVGENQNALAQYQLESARRTDLQQNALNEGYAQSIDPATGQINYGNLNKFLAGRGAGSQIPAVLKQQAEFKEAQDKSAKLQSELLVNKLRLLPDAYKMATTPDAYIDLHKSIHADPILGPWLKSTGATPERGFAQIQKAIETGTFDKLRMDSMQSVDQLLEGLKPKTDIGKLIEARNQLPLNDPNRKLYDKEIEDRGAANRNAQQRLAFDQAKFAWEKANPTKSIQDDGTGLVAVDTRTGTATPVVYGANGIQTAPAAPSVTVDGRSFPGLRTEVPVSRAGTQVPAKGAGAPTEGERKAATLLQRLQGSQNQLTQALLDDPTAAGPGAFAAAVGKLSTTGANLLNSEERQRVEAAQLDILDAALTLGTGAAYTREQLEGYRQSYFPIYGDKPKNIKDKQERLQNVIDAANIAAGKAGKLVPKPPPVTGGSDVRSAADKILGAK